MVQVELDAISHILSLDTAPPDSLTAEHRQRLTGAFEAAENEDDLAALAQIAQRALDEFGDNLRALYAGALFTLAERQRRDSGSS